MPDLDHILSRPRPRYSICTLVTEPSQYAEMLASFRAGGFIEPDCEFIAVDNTKGNRFDGYSGCNAFLSEASGERIILCHQDVMLLTDGRAALDERLTALAELDPTWGVCGNAGTTVAGKTAIRLSHPGSDDQKRGPFPAKVLGLDENFIVVRRMANLAVPHNLHGFHLYGTVLCLVAADLGLSSYVIDFHLRHNSLGNRDQSFFDTQRQLIEFRSGRQRTKIVGATSGTTVLAASLNLSLFWTFLFRAHAGRLVRKLFRQS